MIRNLISNQFKSILNEPKFGNPNIITKINNNTLSNYCFKSCFSTKILSDKKKLKIREEKQSKKQKLQFKYNIPNKDNNNNNNNENNNENNNNSNNNENNNDNDKNELPSISEYIDRGAGIFNKRPDSGFNHNFSQSNLINGGNPIKSEDIKNKFIYMAKGKSSASIDKMYKGMVNSFKDVYLEENITELKRNPKEYFANKQNHLLYIKYLASKTRGIGFNDMSTWYNFRRKDFIQNHGSELLKLYGDDHVQALISIYPSHDWLLWKFPTLNPSFWDEEKNVVKYLNWLIKKFKGKMDFEKCYHLTNHHFISNYGQHLLQINKESVPSIFRRYFPDYDWKEWLFSNISSEFLSEYFKKKENLKKFILWLGFDILKYKEYEDFYQIKLKDFEHTHGFPIIREKYKKSVMRFVMDTLGDVYDWQSWRFKISPNHGRNYQILSDYHNHLYKLLNCSTPEELIQKVESQLNETPSIDIIKSTHGEDIIKEFGSLRESFVRITQKPWDSKQEQEEEDNYYGDNNHQLDGADAFELNEINEEEFDEHFEIDQKDEHIEEYKKDQKKDSQKGWKYNSPQPGNPKRNRK
ncbi:hypothetical protein ACTFIU_004747 [Dictyostelium citrinum]